MTVQKRMLDAEKRELQQRIEDLEQTQRLLQAMAEETSRVFGTEFFRSLVTNVARLFGVRYVLLAEAIAGDPFRVRTLAYWAGDRLAENFEYDVRWSPCENTLCGQAVFYPDSLPQRFPRDRDLTRKGLASYCGLPLVTSCGRQNGHFAVLHDRPLEHNLCESPTVQIFVARAAAELERKQVALQLERHRDELAYISRLSTLGELAAGIAHELNQPLAAVANYTSAAIHMVNGNRSTPADPEHLVEVLSGAENAAHRASEIVRRLRVLVGRHPVNHTAIDLNELVRESVDLIHSELEQHHVRLGYDLAEDLPPLPADRIQLQQVLLNLVRNAVEAMTEVDRERREIILRSRVAPDEVCVTVTDRGIGLEPQVAESLFDPFVSTKSDGMGMGLAISRTIVEAHGGRIWAVPHPDHGVSFHFSIPIAVTG